LGWRNPCVSQTGPGTTLRPRNTVINGGKETLKKQNSINIIEKKKVKKKIHDECRKRLSGEGLPRHKKGP